MSNVQLKLDEIWKNDKLPLVLSSSSLNVAPKETTWEGEGYVQDGSDVQGKDGGQYEGDVPREGFLQDGNCMYLSFICLFKTDVLFYNRKGYKLHLFFMFF